MAQSTQYRLVFSIESHGYAGNTITAWVAPLADNGKVKTVSQKIYLNNFHEFELGDEASLRKIFQAMDEISDEQLVLKFGSKIKGGNKLETIFKDEKIKVVIKNFIEKRIHTILEFICQNQILLCLQIARDGYIVDHLVEVSKCLNHIKIELHKTATAVLYKLKLYCNSQQIVLTQSNTKVICNNPAWVIINKKLYHINGINGNMLLPFTSKNEVTVPDNLVATYFKSFVLKLDSTVDIDASGFEIFKINNISHAELQLAESIFDGKYVIKPVFNYGAEKFDFNSIQAERKKMEIDADGNISIKHYVRNGEQELGFVERLNGCELEKTTSKLFAIPHYAAENWMDACDWFRNRKSHFESLGFVLANFYFNDKSVNMEPYFIDSVVKESNDWFDVDIQIKVGEFSFPFKKLINNIKNDDRLFEMPDGSIFIIPVAWFEKYASLVHLSADNGQNFRLTKAQKGLIDGMVDDIVSVEVENQSSLIPVPEALQATLRPYQIYGFQWLANLYENNLGACLADDMGLGKTLQSIALLLHIQANKSGSVQQSSVSGQLDLFSATINPKIRTLIVLPSSLVFNWVIELNKFAPKLSRYVHAGSERHRSSRLIEVFEVIITTYHILVRDIDFLATIEFDAVILDESQQIKNKSSKMFEAVNRISAPFRLTLSGTPIENSLSDLWSQMQFINPGILGSAPAFKKAFQVPIEKEKDEVKKEELLRVVKPFILRRTKKSVAPDLPELTEFVHYCEMTDEQADVYEKEKSKVRNMIILAELEGGGQEKIQILNSLQRLRQIASHPAMISEYAEISSGKFEELIYFLENARQSDEKVLVFSSYVRHLEKYFVWADQNNVPYSKLTGELAQSQRKQQVENFQEKNIPWFFLSLKAGGVGLNLTAAEYVFLIDPWWNPAAEQQAIARAHRIGQHKNVTAIRFITKNTIEEKILELQQKKRILAESIVQEDEFFFALSKEDLVGLVD